MGLANHLIGLSQGSNAGTRLRLAHASTYGKIHSSVCDEPLQGTVHTTKLLHTVIIKTLLGTRSTARRADDRLGKRPTIFVLMDGDRPITGLIDFKTTERELAYVPRSPFIS